MRKVFIYTDGASKGNPGPGGWGAIVADETHAQELGGFEAHTTNNRMELIAAYEAVQYLAAEGGIDDAQIILRTDSMYLMNGAQKWGKGWIRRGWVTLDHKPVSNREVWEPFLKLLEHAGKHIQWENVGGHVGNPGNERVDTIASSLALREKVDLYSGPRDAYAIDLESVAISRDLQEKKSASRTRSKLPAFSYVSEVGGKVEVSKTWGQCEARVRGKKARYKKATSLAEQQALVAEFQNPRRS